MIISNLIEKENGFIYETVLFSICYNNRSRSLEQSGPMPGQEGGSERPTNFEMILFSSPSTRLSPARGEGVSE
jgi:hypothetical protein